MVATLSSSRLPSAAASSTESILATRTSSRRIPLPTMDFLFLARPALLVALLLLAQISSVLSEELQYCSGLNTGSDSDGVFHLYQSNGYCRGQCQGDYAFAVISGAKCWCSDYAPGRTAGISSCNKACNGFPDEQCGGDGFFAYIALEKQPSGTIGAPAPPSPSAKEDRKEADVDDDVAVPMPPSDDEDDIDTVIAGLDLTPSPTPTSTSTTSRAKTTSASSTTFTETPITSIQTVTVGGQIVVETVLAMPEAQPSVQSSDSTSPGLIAGAVIGSLSGLGALGLFVFWFLRNRRKNGSGSTESAGLESAGPGRMPRRNTSLLSRTGLLRSEKSFPGGSAAGTLHSGGGGMGAVEDGSSLTPVSERRSSRPLVFDQRLNPYALMEYDNGSQISITTMADNRDYTRPLNVRNPDPPERR